ncbi:MAG: glycosyltransferase [Chlamydiales bacterium]|nr:glycosyltransferase [Chlamydiales bacterium]
MNILHVEASSGWGGQEMRILREAEGMRQRGHVIVFAVMKEGLLIEKAKAAGFVVYELNFYKRAWGITLFYLLRIFRKHAIDVINTHSSLDSWIGAIAARISRKKIIRTRHLSTSIRPGLNSRILYGYLADFVVTTCQETASAICQSARRSQKSCLSIPTGIHPKTISYEPGEPEKFRKQLGVLPSQLLVGTACFMRSWKGIDDFLQAANLLRHDERIRWVIIGGGHFDTYKRKAEQLRLEGILHFTGHLENPYPAIGALDLFALLSTANEGVSQAILQAAYLQKPLIATSTGGLGEVCIPEETGIQVDKYAPHQVVSAVLRLQNSPLTRLHLGQRAQQVVLESFTFDKMLDQMERVYIETI